MDPVRPDCHDLRKMTLGLKFRNKQERSYESRMTHGSRGLGQPSLLQQGLKNLPRHRSRTLMF